MTTNSGVGVLFGVIAALVLIVVLVAKVLLSPSESASKTPQDAPQDAAYQRTGDPVGADSSGELDDVSAALPLPTTRVYWTVAEAQGALFRTDVCDYTHGWNGKSKCEVVRGANACVGKGRPRKTGKRKLYARFRCDVLVVYWDTYRACTMLVVPTAPFRWEAVGVSDQSFEARRISGYC